MKQAIPLLSIRNARELGGYKASDGRQVRSGVLLRTGCLYGISADDMRTLTDVYRTAHIIDFRMEEELAAAADPAVGDAVCHHLNVIDPSLFPDTGEEEEIGGLDIVRSVALSEQIGAMDGRMYIGFLSSQAGRAAYEGFFRVLLSADPDRAVLWHCTSGKDRTGLAAMLLLSLLGVDEETVVSDFLLTNDFNAKEIDEARRDLASQGFDPDFIEKAVLVLSAVDGRVLRRAIAYLKEEYGSVTGYIRCGLHLTEAEIDSLKEKYLV